MEHIFTHMVTSSVNAEVAALMHGDELTASAYMDAEEDEERYQICALPSGKGSGAEAAVGKGLKDRKGKKVELKGNSSKTVTKNKPAKLKRSKIARKQKK